MLLPDDTTKHDHVYRENLDGSDQDVLQLFPNSTWFQPTIMNPSNALNSNLNNNFNPDNDQNHNPPPKWLKPNSPAIDHFSPSETCLLQILPHCMTVHVSIVRGHTWVNWHMHSTVWSVGVPATINEWVIVSCVSVHARCITMYKNGTYILTYFYIRGRTVQPGPSRFGLSNYNYQGVDSPILPETATSLQCALTKICIKCTNCSLCVWQYHRGKQSWGRWSHQVAI